MTFLFRDRKMFLPFDSLTLEVAAGGTSGIIKFCWNGGLFGYKEVTLPRPGEVLTLPVSKGEVEVNLV